MNTIDSLLGASPGPLPRRPLDRSFTQATVARLGERPAARRRGLGWLVRHRPIAAAGLSLGAVLLIGGGAYGVTHGFGFLNALFGQETTLPNGERILSIDTNNCAAEWREATTGGFTRDDTRLYYRLQKDATLTAEQVTQMVQGKCEATSDEQGRYGDVLSTIMNTHPQIDGSTMRSGFLDYRVTAITPTSLTIETDERLFGGEDPGVVLETEHVSRTYREISAKVVVVDEQGRSLEWSDIRPGDHISIVYSTPDVPATSPADLHRDTTGDVILAVMKTPPNVVAYAEGYDQAYGVQFRQVAPCDSDSSGYCDVFRDK